MKKLVEEAKALNIPRRNLMKKDQLKQAIKDTVDRHKEIIFGSDVICKDCLNELKKQRKIDEVVGTDSARLELSVCFRSLFSHENVDRWGNDSLHGLWFNARGV